MFNRKYTQVVVKRKEPQHKNRLIKFVNRQMNAHAKQIETKKLQIKQLFKKGESKPDPTQTDDTKKSIIKQIKYLKSIKKVNNRKQNVSQMKLGNSSIKNTGANWAKKRNPYFAKSKNGGKHGGRKRPLNVTCQSIAKQKNKFGKVKHKMLMKLQNKELFKKKEQSNYFLEQFTDNEKRKTETTFRDSHQGQSGIANQFKTTKDNKQQSNTSISRTRNQGMKVPGRPRRIVGSKIQVRKMPRKNPKLKNPRAPKKKMQYSKFQSHFIPAAKKRKGQPMIKVRKLLFF